MKVYYHAIPTPSGPITAVCDEQHLLMLSWGFNPHEGSKTSRRLGLDKAQWHVGEHPILAETSRQLGEYFKGERQQFDLPLLLLGSEFQCSVWRQLQAIPFGTTLSYAGLATAIGKPNAHRAVANANGANALPIVIPCHRVIGSDGKLAGYTGGTHIKQHLLAVEGIHL
jgi:methylated-DNA-[protein]-cysteine S-methyltransferase